MHFKRTFSKTCFLYLSRCFKHVLPQFYSNGPLIRKSTNGLKAGMGDNNNNNQDDADDDEDDDGDDDDDDDRNDK